MSVYFSTLKVFIISLTIENEKSVKVGYLKKSCLTNCDKMRILKMGISLFKWASRTLASIYALTCLQLW